MILPPTGAKQVTSSGVCPHSLIPSPSHPSFYFAGMGRTGNEAMPTITAPMRVVPGEASADVARVLYTKFKHLIVSLTRLSKQFVCLEFGRITEAIAPLMVTITISLIACPPTLLQVRLEARPFLSRSHSSNFAKAVR